MSRYYVNSLPDFSRDVPLLPGAGSGISNTDIIIKTEIESIYQRLLKILEDNLCERISDSSIYTGTAGISYLYLLLANKEKKTNFLLKSIHFAEESLNRLRNRDATFLCGDTGPLVMSAVSLHLNGSYTLSRKHVSAVLDLLPAVIDSNSDMPCELLYGRVGYLYSLLFLEKHIPGCIQKSYMKQIADVVIMSGRTLSRYKKFAAPLLWEWYDELYVGGAHGIAGILYLLLQVKDVLSDEQMNAIRSTVDYLLTIRFPSGNFPSSIGSAEDRLVHWCHGAPGVVQLLLSAYRVWGEEKYYLAAETCGEIVWERGLLRKGYGICHGVAGNAYTFIALYQVTRDEKHLHRATQFAKWCDTFDKYQERPPDRPFSLFEGLAGTVYFLKDIQDPLNAVFPAFTLEPFK